MPVPLRGPDLARPIRVAVVLDPGGHGTAMQVQDGVRKAASALEDADYAVEEFQPPGIDAAAKALVVMDSTPGIRAAWEQVVSASSPVNRRRFASAFFVAAGEPDVVAAEGAFVTRHALLSGWSEFQESHPLILAPIATDIPALAGTDLDEGRVAEDLRTMRMAMAVNALGLPAVAVPVGSVTACRSRCRSSAPATARTCAWTRRKPSRSGSGSSRRSIPGSGDGSA